MGTGVGHTRSGVRARLGVAAAAFLALGALSAVAPSGAAAATSRARLVPHVVAAATPPVRPAPIAAATSFAATRGPGYEQRLNLARQQAARLPVVAQPNANVTATTPWTPLGPAPGVASTSTQYVNYGGTNSGRITGLAVSPSGTVYAASAGGGVWSSTNGTSWVTNTDSQPDIAMGSVTVDPFDASYVFAGTGEDNQCADCFYGDGILESSDGGTTWTTVNPGAIFTGADISSIAVVTGTATAAPTEVLAGTSQGLYVSTDGGSTWTAEAGTGWATGNVTSLAVDQSTTPPTIYAGVAGAGVEISTDNGANWTVEGATAGLAGTGAANASAIASVALAVAPAVAPAIGTVYASVAETSNYIGLFKSTDGGTTWTQLANAPLITSYGYGYGSGAGGQGNYDNAVAVDPANPNIVVLGGITAAESQDGGTSWTSLNAGGNPLDDNFANSFHPDVHALVFDASGNLYMGNDGGVWGLPAASVTGTLPMTTSGFVNLNGNLDVTQFYAGMSSVQGTTSGTQILAGAQDNGTMLYSSTATTPTQWPIMDTGDGGYALIDPTNPQIQYAEADAGTATGGLDMTTDGWTSYTFPGSSSDNVIPNGYTPGEWAPPLLFVPGSAGSPDKVLFGAASLYESTAGQSTSSTWTPLNTGTTGSASTYVSALAVAPSNSAVLYAGYNTGVIDMSTDGGTTWQVVTPPTVPAGTSEVTHLSVSPTDPYTLYVTLSASAPGADATAAPPAVLVGSGLDTAPAWTNVTSGLPTLVPTNAVIPDGAGGLIVADDVGVFWAQSLNGSSTSWVQLGSGLPGVQVVDVALTANGTLLAETHGRGIWSMPLPPPGTPYQLAVTTEPPSNVNAGAGFTVDVGVQDIGGTLVTTDSTTPVSLGIAPGTGSAGAALSCGTNPVTATAGVASFNCSINEGGSGYELTATSPGLNSASTSQITVATSLTVTSLTPNTGPAAGGTVVTIVGTGFSTTGGATAVTFGTTAATNVSCSTTPTTSCSATSPPGAGAVNVTVTVGGVSSSPATASTFTYVAPTVTSLAPNTGPAAGGTTVTIDGTGFSPGATTVDFGATAATNVTCSTTTTTCTATAPAGTGAVSVTVTVGGATSVPVAAATFTYQSSTTGGGSTGGGTSGGSTGGGAPGGSTGGGTSGGSTGGTTSGGGSGGTSTTTTTTPPPVAPPPTMAPLPPGSPAGVYGAPVSATVSGTSATSLGESSGGAHVAVSVPAGALPAGTAVTVETVTNAGAIQRLVPGHQAYVTSFSVSWLAPGGTAPVATSPVTMTITDPSIAPGDSVYELTASGLKLLGVATEQGTITVSFTTDPDIVVVQPPRLARVGRTAAHNRAILRVVLGCDRGVACTGTAVVRARRGRGPSVVVARGAVALPGGRTRIVTLRLTPEGRRLLGALGRRREAGIMAVSLDGASSTRHVLVI